MTYDTEVEVKGRIPYARIELHLNSCAEVYGVSPCTAALGAGNECYNTYSTCQDTANFNSTTKTVAFETPTSNYSVPGITPTFPCIIGFPNVTAAEMPIKGGIALRSTLSINVKDFEHNDRGVDPYYSNRTTSGTFFGKLLARNRYYIGRTMLLRMGFVDDTEAVHVRASDWVISAIEGPFRSGNETTYRIIGKDVLELASLDRALCPAPSDSWLNAGIDASPFTTTCVLHSSSTETNFPTGGGLISMGDEWMFYTSRSSYTISGMTRGSAGTTPRKHKAGDAVQLVQQFSGSPLDVANALLTTHAGVNSSYLPHSLGPTGSDQWDVQENTYYSGTTITTAYIGEPTPVQTLLQELAETYQFSLTWSEVAQEVICICGGYTLGINAFTLTEDADLIQGKTRVRELPDKRISRVLIRYNMLNYTKYPEVVNFNFHEYNNDTTVEGVNAHNDIRGIEINSRWAFSGESTAIANSATWLLDRLKETPLHITFQVDASNSSMDVGDMATITTSAIQTVAGLSDTVDFRISKRTEVEFGHVFEYEGYALSY